MAKNIKNRLIFKFFDVNYLYFISLCNLLTVLDSPQNSGVVTCANHDKGQIWQPPAVDSHGRVRDSFF